MAIHTITIDPTDLTNIDDNVEYVLQNSGVEPVFVAHRTAAEVLETSEDNAFVVFKDKTCVVKKATGEFLYVWVKWSNGFLSSSLTSKIVG